MAAATATRRDDLVIDVGMHVGQDTRFYLDKGFRVVSVEANPDLVAAAEERFAAEIDNGRLKIVAAAITEREDSAVLKIADDKSEWSTLDAGFAERNRVNGVQYRSIEVPAIRFEDVLAAEGVPYYLKIDIEGLDMLCVRALRAFPARPAYISLESAVTSNTAPYAASRDELAALYALGFRRFKYVNMALNPRQHLPEPPREGRYVDAHFTTDSSGPFGAESPGRWQTRTGALARAQTLRLHQNLGGYGGRWTDSRLGRRYSEYAPSLLRTSLGWYDLHAAL